MEISHHILTCLLKTSLHVISDKCDMTKITKHIYSMLFYLKKIYILGAPPPPEAQVPPAPPPPVTSSRTDGPWLHPGCMSCPSFQIDLASPTLPGSNPVSNQLLILCLDKFYNCSQLILQFVTSSQRAETLSIFGKIVDAVFNMK